MFGWVLAGLLLRWAARLVWWTARTLTRLAWWLASRLVLVAAALLALPFSRRLAGRCLAAAVSGRGVRQGGRGVLQGSGHRTPDSVAQGTSSPAAKLQPVPAQRIATATYARRRYWTRGFDGPELLEMLCGPAGTGKTEVKLGQIRAGWDGQPFCGLETTPCRRVLLLSEMGGATLQPALRRWGFYVEPASRLDAVRLRVLPPRGYAGGLIHVVYAADVYAPRLVEGVMQETDWAAVVAAVRGLVDRGRYDRVVIDSLGEWMGADNNEAMLKTLGACRQLTHAGAGVTVLHHTPRSDPKRPRGGTVIEAKLDIGWSVTGTGERGKTHSRADAVRVLDWFKTRFPEDTPPESLTVERAWGGPESGELPRYRLVGTRAAESVAQVAAAKVLRDAELAPALPPPAAAPPQQERVRAALTARGLAGGTVGDLARETGLPRQRVDESLKALCGQSAAFQRGTVPIPGGGTPAARYVATAALLTMTPDPEDAPSPSGGAGGPRDVDA